MPLGAPHPIAPAVTALCARVKCVSRGQHTCTFALAAAADTVQLFASLQQMPPDQGCGSQQSAWAGPRKLAGHAVLAQFLTLPGNVCY